MRVVGPSWIAKVTPHTRKHAHTNTLPGPQWHTRTMLPPPHLLYCRWLILWEDLRKIKMWDNNCLPKDFGGSWTFTWRGTIKHAVWVNGLTGCSESSCGTHWERWWSTRRLTAHSWALYTQWWSIDQPPHLVGKTTSVTAASRLWKKAIYIYIYIYIILITVQ